MADGPLLVLDTATRTPLVALARRDGSLIGVRRWESRHRHGERLLEELDGLLAKSGVAKSDIGGVVVGTGPGSFTGLRIGLATAKVVAYSLGVPLVGVSTTRALALASGVSEAAVTLAAGAADRYVHVVRLDAEADQPARLTVPGEAFREAAEGALLVAVDLEAEDVPPDAVERGRAAVGGLAAALARDGAAALARGERHDPATLVPAYVALPRGIARAAEDIAWSPDLR